MKLTPNSFFPEFNFIEMNLNDYFTKGQFPLVGNQPAKQQDALDLLHDSKERYTYGGYGENRKDMWKGTYLDEGEKYIHLGIDINVPFNTPIYCPFDVARVVAVFKDTDQDVGWGTRLILKPRNSGWCLVLGHLKWQSQWVSPFKKDEIIGHVGTYPTNGNVFEHLHIQVILWDAGNFGEFDGYGHEADLVTYPNPFEVEWP